MSEMTRILSAIEQGDSKAAEQLLPLVYDELRKLATQRLAQEKPGQTLQATALVHEAHIRLEARAQSASDEIADPMGREITFISESVHETERSASIDVRTPAYASIEIDRVARSGYK